MLIDEYLPEYEFLATYAIEVNAPIERVYPVVQRMDLRNAYLLRLLFWLRSIPGILAGRNPLGPTLADLERAGATVLEESPPQELVMGFVGKIWTMTGGIRKISSMEFRQFSEPGVAKVAWNFSLEPLHDGRTRLTTQTRVQCFDKESQEKLRRYAFFMRSISGMTRKSALRGLKSQAQGLPA